MMKSHVSVDVCPDKRGQSPTHPHKDRSRRKKKKERRKEGRKKVRGNEKKKGKKY
jgi:hypothetical protein